MSEVRLTFFLVFCAQICDHSFCAVYSSSTSVVRLRLATEYSLILEIMISLMR